MAGAAIATYVAVFGLVLPAAQTFRLSPRLAEAIARVAGCPVPKLVSAGYDEPSLVFATHTDIRLEDPRTAADFLKGDGCRLALVEARKAEAFLARADKRGIAVEKLETVTGMSLGRLDTLSIGIWRAGPAPDGASGG